MTQNQDMHRVLVENQADYFHKSKSITWSAVVSGAFIAFGLTFLFNLLTIGIGLAIFTTNEEGIKNLAFNGFIWTLFGGAIILFIAGWKTGKLIKLCPSHLYSCKTESVSSPSNPSSQYATTETTYRNKVCCAHGMTHGFLAWVLYLMISLLFTLFIMHAASIASLKSSLINIPLGFSQAIVEGTANPHRNGQGTTTRANANQQSRTTSTTTTTNDEDVTTDNKETTATGTQQTTTTGNQATRSNTQQEASNKQITTEKAQQTGEDLIALFLIFALGAAATSIGSYLGLLAHKKCLENRMK